MRITQVKVEDGEQGRGYPGGESIDIGSDYATDLAEAVEKEHPCCPFSSAYTACDISNALEQGFPFSAAHLLSGATETPLMERVVAAHLWNGTGSYNPYGTDTAPDWEAWSDWFDEHGVQCEACNAYSFDSDHCGNCGKSLIPYFRVRFAAYCGMVYDISDCNETKDDARDTAAYFLRKLRRKGRKIATLERGRKWEALEPDDCVLVPDDAGCLEIDKVEV